jgi:hypothetical protein
LTNKPGSERVSRLPFWQLFLTQDYRFWSSKLIRPENHFAIRKALILAGRIDLIHSGCDCLTPAQLPNGVIEA